MAQYVEKIHANPFKHGWCADLSDPAFERLYKETTGITLISNNYDRDTLSDEFPIDDVHQQEVYMMIRIYN